MGIAGGNQTTFLGGVTVQSSRVITHAWSFLHAWDRVISRGVNGVSCVFTHEWEGSLIRKGAFIGV